MHRYLLVILALFVVGSALAQSSRGPNPIKTKHVQNVHRIVQNVFSGGSPNTNHAFAELKELGIRTLISVDSTIPDRDLAKQHGLAYFHLPQNYRGISARDAKLLSKIIRESEGRVYIHCHHGIHRAPTAAAVGCIGLGTLSSQSAEKVLKSIGTDPQYRGLYLAVRNADRISDDELTRVKIVDTTEKSPAKIAHSMALSHRMVDALRASSKIRWQRPPEQKEGWIASHEALILHDELVELARQDHDWKEDRDFDQLLRQSADKAKQLHKTLLRSDHPEAVRVLMQLEKSCSNCHEQYR